MSRTDETIEITFPASIARLMEYVAELEAERDELHAEIIVLKRVIKFVVDTGRIPTGYIS